MDIPIERFHLEFQAFQKLARRTARNPVVSADDLHPCLGDRSSTTGFDHAYIYHTAWAARILAQQPPALHVDISSSLYFNVLVSAFLPVEFYDYRPAELSLSGLKCGHADLCNLFFESGSIASLSCMHVMEHIGLGRYGDPLDPDGDLKAARELQRVVRPGGQLLMVVPVGRSRICFNAHRIYAYADLLAMFPELTLKSFALVTDQGVLDQAPGAGERVAQQAYGCGCFQFVREA